ncbi:hypothetical protein N9934_01550, partial [Desulfosarcina sp.]|nr:hypothetical protein [Desulfosarcina sp.]
MKKRGILLLSLLILVLLSSFAFGVNCCVNYPNDNYCTLDWQEPNFQFFCCFEGAYDEGYDACIDPVNSEDLYYDTDCANVAECIEEELNCCIDENTLQCTYGYCESTQNSYVGDWPECNGQEDCMLGCCCDPYSTTDVNWNIAHFACDSSGGEWHPEALSHQECLDACEIVTLLPQCANGIDDDSDGLVDGADPGCLDEWGVHDVTDNEEENCGNGALESNEECDGTLLDEEDCTSLGQGTGELQCEAGTCVFDYSGCTGPELCGNNVIDPGETCDDGYELNGEECEVYYSTPAVPCTYCEDNCQEVTLSGPTCGDGTINNAIEECDDGNEIPNDGCTNCLLDGVQAAVCSDGADNDGDYLIDFNDPGCWDEFGTGTYNPDGDSEGEKDCNNDGYCDGWETFESCDDCECPVGTTTWDDEGCLCEFQPDEACSCLKLDPNCPEYSHLCSDGTAPGECSPNYLGQACNNDLFYEEQCQEGDDPQCVCPFPSVCVENSGCEYVYEEICDDDDDNDGDTFYDCEDDDCHTGPIICSDEESEKYQCTQTYQNKPEHYICCQLEANDCNSIDGEYTSSTPEGDKDGFPETCGPCTPCIEGPSDPTLMQTIETFHCSQTFKLNWELETCEGAVDSFTVYYCSTQEEGEECDDFIPLPSVDSETFEYTFGFEQTETTFYFKIGAHFLTGDETFSNVEHKKSGHQYCYDECPTSSFCLEDENLVPPATLDYTYVCGDPDNYIYPDDECYGDQQCGYNPFLGEAICHDIDDCKDQCNEPLGAFGLTGHSTIGFSSGNFEPELDCLYEAPECYYDKSDTAADEFKGCSEIHEDLGCYGYLSKEACQGLLDTTFNNKCFPRDCVWKDINPEFGIGVCIEEEEEDQKCELCSDDLEGLISNFREGRNQIFDVCTIDACKAYGSDNSCFPSSINEFGVVEECISKVRASCETFTSSTSPQATIQNCVGVNYLISQDEYDDFGFFADVDYAGVYPTLTRINYTNTIVRESNDAFDFGVCRLENGPYGPSCYTDPNYDGEETDSEYNKDNSRPMSVLTVAPNLIESLTDHVLFARFDLDQNGIECEEGSDTCSGISQSYVSMVEINNSGYPECYDYVGCVECALKNREWLTTEFEFEGTCGDPLPGYAPQVEGQCPLTDCFSYPLKAVSNAGEIETEFIDYPSGQYALYYYSEDKATNLETVKHTLVTLDKEGPFFTLEPDYIIYPGTLPVPNPPNRFESKLSLFLKSNEYANSCEDSLTGPDGSVSTPGLGDLLISPEGQFSFSTSFENLPDGQYTYWIKCKDLLGNYNGENEEGQTFPIINIDMDPRVSNPFPIGVINMTRFNMSVDTGSNISCSYNNDNTPEHWTVISPDMVEELEDPDPNGYKKYRHNVPMNLYVNGDYDFTFKCQFPPDNPEKSIHFVLDTTRPNSVLENSFSLSYIFSDWKHQHYGINPVCNDYPENGFGCDRLQYAISPLPIYEFDKLNKETDFESVISERITAPRWLCTAAVEEKLGPLNSPYAEYMGGLREEVRCVEVFAEDIPPFLEVPLLDESEEAGTVYVTNQLTPEVKGRLIDYDYDSESSSQSVDSWGQIGPNEINIKNASEGNSIVRSKEGYRFNNIIINASVKISDDDKPLSFGILFGAENEEEYFGAFVGLEQGAFNQNFYIAQKTVGDQNPQIISNQIFRQIDSGDYTMLITAQDSSITFELFNDQSISLGIVQYNGGFSGEDFFEKEGYLGNFVLDGEVTFTRVLVKDLNMDQDNTLLYAVDQVGNAAFNYNYLGNSDEFTIYPLLLHEGINELTLLGEDKASNQLMGTYEIYLDQSGPNLDPLKFYKGNGYIDVKETNNFEYGSSEYVNFSIDVSDVMYDGQSLVNVSEVYMTFNDYEYDFEFDSFSSGKFNFKKDLLASIFGHGVHNVSITAKDEFGNSNTTWYLFSSLDTKAPEFHLELFWDETFTEKRTIAGLGPHYIKLNSSEPATIEYLNVTTSFNSKEIKVYLSSGVGVTEWIGVFVIDDFGFWNVPMSNNNKIEFDVFLAKDVNGVEQDTIETPNTVPFNGEGPEIVDFDPSFDEEYPTYHELYSDKLYYYPGEEYLDDKVFMTKEDNLFLTLYSPKANLVNVRVGELLTENVSQITKRLTETNYNPEVAQTVPAGNEWFRIDSNLFDSPFQEGNYLEFSDDFRKEYTRYKHYYKIEELSFSGQQTNIRVSPAFENGLSAGETVVVYDNYRPTDRFELYSSNFTYGYNEIYATAFDNYSYSSSEHYYILYDNLGPAFESEYPYDGWIVNSEYLDYINFTLSDAAPSSRIVPETVNMTVEFKSFEDEEYTIIQEGAPSNLVDGDLDDLNEYFIGNYQFSSGQPDDGYYIVHVNFMDRAGNKNNYTWSFVAMEGVYAPPTLTQTNGGLEYTNGYDLYNNQNYFTTFTSGNIGFNLLFNENEAEVVTLEAVDDLSDLHCFGSGYEFTCEFVDPFGGTPSDLEIIHHLNITAYNSEGNSTSWPYNYVVDNGNPVITGMEYPSSVTSSSTDFDVTINLNMTDESFRLNASLFIIEGGVDRLLKTAKTQPLDLITFDNVLSEENLSEGLHTLRFVIFDQSGNYDMEEGILYVDNTPPTITLDTIVANTTDKQALWVPEGWNESGVTNYEWRTNDEVVKVILDSSEPLASLCYTNQVSGDCASNVIYPTSQQDIEIEVLLQITQDLLFENTVSFIAEDTAGNTFTLEVPIITDLEAPQPTFTGAMNIEDPLTMSTNEETIILAHKAYNSTDEIETVILSNTADHEFTFGRNGLMYNGDYTLLVNMSDVFGNFESTTHYFTLYQPPFNITLVEPSYGWTATEDFTVVLETNRGATCKYNLVPFNNYENILNTQIMGTSDNTHHSMNFNINDITNNGHAYVYFMCKDVFGEITPRDGSQRYEFTYNPNAPSILFAEADPETIVTESEIPGIGWTLMTTFSVDTDIPSICRYSETESNYDSMEGEFPGFGEENEVNVWGFPFATEEYSYYVACASLADVASETVVIEFDIDPTQDVSLQINSPVDLIQTNTAGVPLDVSTNRVSSCEYTFDGENWVSFGQSNSNVHQTSLSVNPEEGWVSVYVKCSTEDFGEATGEGRYGLDLSPPTITEVNVPKEVYEKEFIEINSIIAEDTVSPIEAYQYELRKSSDNSIVKEWTTVSSSTNIYVGGLELDGYENYYFNIRVNDTVFPAWSNIFKSSDIYVNLSLQINLIEPSFGWTGTEDFTVVLETNRDAICKWNLDPFYNFNNVPESRIMGTGTGLLHNEDFNINDITSNGHAYVYFMCMDEYGDVSPSDGARRYEFVYNPDAPFIISAEADPDNIISSTQLENGNWVLMTTFVVKTDIPSQCRYSETQINYDNMEGEFPEHGELNEVDVSGFLLEPAEYTYNVACKSLSDVVSTTEQIIFYVDPSQDVSLQINSPN